MSEELNEAKSLATKWSTIVEGVDAEGASLGFAEIKQTDRKRHTAQLLENTEREYIKEGVPTNTVAGIDIVDPVIINLVRRTAPNLLAYDLVGVQPMTGPTGLVFAMRAHYGAQPKGPFGRPGDARNGFQQGDTSLTSGRTDAEQNGYLGSATNEAFYNEPRAAYSGTGTQTSNATAPDYSAYSVPTGLSTGAAETLGGGLSGNAVWNEMSFTIEKTSVEATTRALKAEYSTEVAQDLKAVHGLDAETELANILSTEILAEINREITNRIRQVAKIAPAEPLYENGAVVTDSTGAVVNGTAGAFDINTQSDGR